MAEHGMKRIYLPDYNRRLKEEGKIRKKLRYASEADRIWLLEELDRARQKRKAAVLYVSEEV